MQKNKHVRREDLYDFGLCKALGHVDADFGNGAALALDVVRHGLFKDSFNGFAPAGAELVAKGSQVFGQSGSDADCDSVFHRVLLLLEAVCVSCREIKNPPRREAGEEGWPSGKRKSPSGPTFNLPKESAHVFRYEKTIDFSHPTQKSYLTIRNRTKKKLFRRIHKAVVAFDMHNFTSGTVEKQKFLIIEIDCSVIVHKSEVIARLNPDFHIASRFYFIRF